MRSGVEPHEGSEQQASIDERQRPAVRVSQYNPTAHRVTGEDNRLLGLLASERLDDVRNVVLVLADVIDVSVPSARRAVAA